jgi:hypothetical protein
MVVDDRVGAGLHIHRTGICLPVLSDIHNAAGPFALVLLVVAALLFFLPMRKGAHR